MNRQEVSEWAEAHDVELALYEPADIFDDAIIGIVRRGSEFFVLYDEDAVLRGLAEDVWEATTEEERASADFDPISVAREHYEFNTLGTWIGYATPGFLVETEGWSS